MATQKQISALRLIAEENYETWGDVIVEAYTDDELSDFIDEAGNVQKAIDFCKSYAEYRADIQAA